MEPEVIDSGATLRDTISGLVDKVEAGEPLANASAPSVVSTAAADTRTAEERARDEKGRFVEGKTEKNPKDPLATAPAQPVVDAKPRPKVPSSWKKDFHPHWEKLTTGAPLTPQEALALAEYTGQREGEYAKGVSTYKTEWERAKPLIDAVAPHSELFRQQGIDPAAQISKYIEIHKGLVMGSPEQKLSTFMQLARDYQVPVQNLFQQGQDGKIYFNPQVQAYQPAPQPQQKQQDVSAVVREALANERAAMSIAEFEREASTKYPHYETVKESMAGLLQSGQAQDLQDAYTKAIRLNDDLWKLEQENTRKADEVARAEAQRKAVANAKANAVSPRTATPSSAGKGESKKGLRATLESAFDEHTSAGRV